VVLFIDSVSDNLVDRNLHYLLILKYQVRGAILLLLHAASGYTDLNTLVGSFEMAIENLDPEDTLG